MGLKKIFVAALLAAGSAAVVAQEEFTPEYLAKTTSYRERFSSNMRDSITSERYYNRYVRTFNKARQTDSLSDWKDFHYAWKKLVEVAPYATHNLTNLGSGAWVFEQKLLPMEQDPVQRYAYFKELMWIYDFRINHLKQLNAIPRDNGDKRPPLDLGAAMIQRAHAYHQLGQESGYAPGKTYDKVKAYQNFVAAFDTIRAKGIKSTNTKDADDENEIDPYYTEEYFLTGRDLYLMDKDKYMEQFLTDYTTFLETCDMMMATYNGVDSVKYAQYAMRRNNIEFYFVQSGAGSAENLTKYYTPRLNENKENQAFLKKAVHLMIQKDSLLAENVFARACQLSYNLEPDYENCIGMALVQKNQFEDKTEALKYFNKADELAKTPAERYATKFNIGMALASEPAPSEKTVDGWAQMSTAEHNDLVLAWRGRQRAAAAVLNESLMFAKEAGKPTQYWAPIYYSMASAYRKAGERGDLDNAEECLRNVALAYAPYAESHQNGIDYETEQIANARTRLAEAQAREAEYRKNKAQYEAYQRRQAEIARKQAEEAAFWGKK